MTASKVSRLKYKICFLFLTFLMPLANGQKFEGDSCQMKSVNGVCKLASQCPELETAVRAGMFSTRDIINCGYTTREEIICCPTGERVTTENRSDDRLIFEQTDTTTTTTTTPAPTSTDFWSHLLTPEMTTTPQPDFWLHLLNSTTTATLLTTTPTPLIVNGKQLDPDSEFIDLSDLLSQKGRRQKNSAIPTSNNIEPVQSEPIKLRAIPDSINDRTFGWPTPAINQPQPRPAPWNAGSTIGMPFRDDRRNSRRDRLTWESAQQPNSIWPNQQESNIRRPASNWPTAQPHRFSNQIPLTAADGFQEPNRRNDRRQPPPQWQNGNEFVENFRPSSNGARNENMFQRPPLSNSLPNRPIWPAENNQQKNSNSFTDPIAFVNDNLMKNGMDIIKAKASEVDRFNKWHFDASSSAEFTTTTSTTTTTTTTQRARVSDIFAPFQFRPQPDADYDDDNEISKNVLPSHRGSSDFRFPGEAEIRPAWNFDQSKNTATTPTPVKNSTTISPRTNDRPAIAACREIESGRDPSLSFHVLDGTPVELKEFPHMAAIGYVMYIGNDDGPYDYRCGGTLIAKRFVLTAAHCVNSRESQPAVVLLGLVNMNDPDERQFSEEIKIRRVHIHDDYSSSRTYHDVAVLELEREVTYTEYIYPTCLYTELTDPPPPFEKQVYVSGWGRIRTGSREKSGILLKAKLEVVPVSQCNASYVEMGLNRRIDVGVMNSQMCAHDPGLTKDACEGDSGGPLLMVEDEAFRKYKVIGIISAGFSCGSATPGLYARVGAYLDYIESIVWPNTAG